MADDLTSWRTNELGDLEKRRKSIKRELESCRRGVLNAEQISRDGVLRYMLDKVEEQIDTYWRQRAHVKWLQFGNRNMTFFHASCSERKRSNKIGKLKSPDGRWVEEEEKRRLITNYFSELFRSSGNCDTRRLLDCVETKVTSDMNTQLLAEFTRDEVQVALKSIGNLKAPGPDGLLALFYKEYWEIMGEKVVTEVLNVL